MMRKSKIPLGDLFPELGLVGDFSALKNIQLVRIVPVEKAEEGDLAFIAQETMLALLSQSKGGVFVVSDGLWEKAQALAPQFTMLRSRDAMLAFAKASRFFQTELPPSPSVHPTAQVHPTARIGANVTIGAFAVVEAAAEVETGVILHAHTYVGERAHVGQDSVLFPGVVIYQDCRLGERVRIHSNSVIGADGFGYVQERTPTGVKHVKIHHIGGVRIGNDVEIGASTTIDRGTLGDTVIGNGCIIDNQVQIGHNCQLEEGVIVCGCTGLAGSVYVEKFAVIAGLVGIANKVRVGTGAQISAFSAVSSNVPPGIMWGGVPAMPRRDYRRLQAYISRLPELFAERKKQGKEA
ncbi:MAG: UDP-3-O-(3-hydroxymyristoyl)glucosamine N-acyltransferase [Bdellovibrionota bacterium]